MYTIKTIKPGVKWKELCSIKGVFVKKGICTKIFVSNVILSNSYQLMDHGLNIFCLLIMIEDTPDIKDQVLLKNKLLDDQAQVKAAYLIKKKNLENDLKEILTCEIIAR